MFASLCAAFRRVFMMPNADASPLRVLSAAELHQVAGGSKATGPVGGW